ncbi:MAG: hypothetical protein WHS83_07050 [Chloroflexus sp.]|uniref:hypothetical protein n=1 Tax=Chloroflexus sp. TaxID=1904827 RepID=UPI003095DFE0
MAVRSRRGSCHADKEGIAPPISAYVALVARTAGSVIIREVLQHSEQLTTRHRFESILRERLA